MIRQRPLVRGLLLIAAGLVLLPVFTYLFLPASRLNAVLTQGLASQGLSLTPEARKTILPGLVWTRPLLSSEQGGVLGFDLLKVRLALLPLLLGRVGLDATASLGEGHIRLQYGVTGREAFSLSASDIPLAGVPFFKTVLGATAGGELWSEGRVTRGPRGLNGELKLEMRQLGFAGVKLGAFPLPDASDLHSQGMVRVTDGMMRLESFTLLGEGIHMRLSGDIPGGAQAMTTPINLTLEIMPKPDFLEKQKLVFLLLAKFMVSPGNYRLPIRGTLLKPEIQ